MNESFNMILLKEFLKSQEIHHVLIESISRRLLFGYPHESRRSQVNQVKAEKLRGGNRTVLIWMTHHWCVIQIKIVPAVKLSSETLWNMRFLELRWFVNQRFSVNQNSVPALCYYSGCLKSTKRSVWLANFVSICWFSFCCVDWFQRQPRRIPLATNCFLPVACADERLVIANFCYYISRVAATD